MLAIINCAQPDSPVLHRFPFCPLYVQRYRPKLSGIFPQGVDLEGLLKGADRLSHILFHSLDIRQGAVCIAEVVQGGGIVKGMFVQRIDLLGFLKGLNGLEEVTLLIFDC